MTFFNRIGAYFLHEAMDLPRLSYSKVQDQVTSEFTKKKVSALGRLTYLILGTCLYPNSSIAKASYKVLIEKTGISSEETISKCLKELKEKGFLSSMGASEYRLWIGIFKGLKEAEVQSPSIQRNTTVGVVNSTTVSVVPHAHVLFKPNTNTTIETTTKGVVVFSGNKSLSLSKPLTSEESEIISKYVDLKDSLNQIKTSKSGYSYQVRLQVLENKEKLIELEDFIRRNKSKVEKQESQIQAVKAAQKEFKTAWLDSAKEYTMCLEQFETMNLLEKRELVLKAAQQCKGAFFLKRIVVESVPDSLDLSDRRVVADVCTFLSELNSQLMGKTEKKLILMEKETAAS